MKNPKMIFSHLFQNSSKLDEQRCLHKLRRLLPHGIQEMIHYLYRRQKTLYFVLTHPGFVMEINYNKKLIKELLTLLRKQEPSCNDMVIEEIKAYAKFIQKPVAPPKPILRYQERASGDFTEPQAFREIFVQIKEAIKRNAEASEHRSKSTR